MLEVSNLDCQRGERLLFTGVHFRLAEGELLYLQGKNGSGKTSLLRILCGLLRPDGVHIRVDPYGRPTADRIIDAVLEAAEG